MSLHIRLLLGCLLCLSVCAPAAAQSKSEPSDKFRQLEEMLPTPNEYRTASGAPGHRYWQQRADYTIDAELDDAARRITARETVTYYNNSPDALSYLWLQLDQNVFARDSDANLTQAAPEFKRETPLSFDTRNPPKPGPEQIPFDTLDRILAQSRFE